MSFRIRGLDPAAFQPLFGRSEADLAALGVRRLIADAKPGFPDRIELRDVEPGESVLLLNYVHQPADTPFRASHAIFVREGATRAYDARNELPEVLLIRSISLRAFDAEGMLREADLAAGDAVQAAIARLLADRNIAYVHAHYARPGCYAARIDRA